MIRVFGIGIQVIAIVSTKHDIDPLLQRSKLLRDTLPSFPAHEHDIHLGSGCDHRDPAEVCQITRDVPWHRAASSNTVFRCCGNNEGKRRHDTHSREWEEH